MPMQHPHSKVLTEFYSKFSSGRIQEAIDLCSPNLSFQIAGKSPLAGKYSSSNFLSGYVQKMKELSDGSHVFEVHDILVSDLHATVLATHKLKRQGKDHELRTVHVWRWEAGKPLAGYEYPRDLYQYDSAWS